MLAESRGNATGTRVALPMVKMATQTQPTTTEATMRDLTCDFGSFSSTSFTVRPLTDAGRAFMARHFGAGAVEATLPKSAGQAVEAAMASEGVTCL